MQFKTILLAVAAVGSAVANPIDNAANAPSAAEMQAAAMAFAKANINNKPTEAQIKAVADFKQIHDGFPFFHGNYPDPCCNQWGIFDWFNLYCFQNYPTFFNTWSPFCYSPPVIDSCHGFFGCCSGGLLGCLL